MVALELLAAFVLIVGGAIVFTNAVEWLGHRLDLGQGAVGALLAAVGTALPESVIPVVALLSGGGSGEGVQIAIGAIIGARAERDRDRGLECHRAGDVPDRQRVLAVAHPEARRSCSARWRCS